MEIAPFFAPIPSVVLSSGVCFITVRGLSVIEPWLCVIPHFCFFLLLHLCRWLQRHCSFGTLIFGTVKLLFSNMDQELLSFR